MATVDYEKLSVSEQIKMGLEELLAHSRGELTLKTTTLPAPPRPAAPKRVIALRKKLKMSQSVFAATLNVSTKLVQSWEQGLRKPDRGEARLLEILAKQPDIVMQLILSNDRVKSSKKPAARKKTAAA